jgi:hypothetical protein
MFPGENKKPYLPLCIKHGYSMIPRTRILAFICLLAICAIPVYSAASLPMVGFTLKPSPAAGPYQDEEFLEKANISIYALSNTTVPNGTTLLEVQSIQQQISKLNISPGLRPVALNINAFLYYTGRAGTEYSLAKSLSGSQYSPVAPDSSQFNDANMYYSAAKTVWGRIQNLYPEVTLYTLSGTTDTTSYNGDTLYTPVSSPHGAYTGLW